MPPAITAIVPGAQAASCAAVSMPRASPAVTTSPVSASARDMPAAIRSPRDEAFRAPTSAIRGRARQRGSPETQITGGASSMSRKRSG